MIAILGSFEVKKAQILLFDSWTHVTQAHLTHYQPSYKSTVLSSCVALLGALLELLIHIALV